MKKLLLISLVILGLSACDNPSEILSPYHDAPTQFIVTGIEQKEGMQKMCAYYVEIVDANDLVRDNGNGRNLMFWFCDSIGKYKLGQPIHFDKFR